MEQEASIQETPRVRSEERSSFLQPNETLPNRALPLDCKASWLACVCASLASFVCVGTCCVYGIFFPAILSEFQAGKAKTALPGSFSVGFLTILCPIAAVFINRFGCRVIIPCGGFISALGLLGSSFAPNIYVLSFTYGFLVAWGSCLVYMAGFLVVPLYFDKQRSAATGMVSAGPGAGVLIMGPIAHILIDYLGWRKTMLVLAGMNLVASILGCAITRKLEQVHLQSKEMTGNLNDVRKNIWSAVLKILSAFKNPMLILVVAMNTTVFFGHFLPLVHLIKYAEDIGISSHASSWIYPVTGFIADYSHSYNPVFYASGCFLLLASMLPFIRHCIIMKRRRSASKLSNGRTGKSFSLTKNKMKTWQSTTTMVSTVDLSVTDSTTKV
ncbi:Monocarboxylate transporter 9 [Exaiptasia diaphana]|nr:Monocarboxylate transporter 9 [Exaiptasia diaphana]